jgi:signal transduction histidine kinase
MGSRTAQPSSVSSPAEPASIRPQLLALLGDLIDRERRTESARTLARYLGADDLLVFVRDPDVAVLLPAFGFPQTLPGGRMTPAFVDECVRLGCHRGEIAFPDSATMTTALGCVAADGSVLVLLGGSPQIEDIRAACHCLPLVASALRVERHAQLAHGHALVAQHAAEQARALAARLDGTRLALQRSLHAAELSRRRSAFLADAAALLASSFEPETTLQHVASLTVPFLADWCIVDVVADRGGGFHRGPVATGDPTQEELAHALVGHHDPATDGAAGVWRVMQTGRPEVSSDVSEATLLGLAGSQERLSEFARIGIKSFMCVPMLARGRTLGTLLFLAAGSGRRFADTDLALATDLAGRIGLAIDSLQLYRNVQEALQVRDDFISVAAHELRTPITPLQLTLESLQMNFKNHRPDTKLPIEAICKKVDIAVRQTDRLIKLVTHVLDISRLSAGRLDLALEDVDLSAIVEEVAARFIDDAIAAGSVLAVQTPGPVLGRWDRLRLDQVVTNYLSNAIKYGAGRPIEIKVEATSTRAQLIVRDYGIGIAPADQARIFKRFERVVSSRYVTGFGLGLWIVGEIVEAMGGTVKVQSALGEGAQFSMDLPRTRNGTVVALRKDQP